MLALLVDIRVFNLYAPLNVHSITAAYRCHDHEGIMARGFMK